MNKGFTLLELMVVIIIVGLLTALALPKLFSVIENARIAEAFIGISTIRAAVERCYLMNSGTYVRCDASNWDSIGIEDISKSPNSHFTYIFDRCAMFNTGGYCIQATRNSRNSGSSDNKILLRWDEANRLYYCGYSEYQRFTNNNGPCPPFAP